MTFYFHRRYLEGNEIGGLSTFKYPAVKWDVPMCVLCFGNTEGRRWMRGGILPWHE